VPQLQRPWLALVAITPDTTAAADTDSIKGFPATPRPAATVRLRKNRAHGTRDANGRLVHVYDKLNHVFD
jgi:hypothetical protein